MSDSETVNSTDFPAEKGTYILWLHLPQPLTIRVGALGDQGLLAGWYAYVGSAFGRGGLRGRLAHHLRPIRKPHWHVDYLRAAAPLQAIWYRASLTVHEHEWAALLHQIPQSQLPIRGFGSSDCDCRSHLLYFAALPDHADFQHRAAVDVGRWSR